MTVQWEIRMRKQKVTLRRMSDFLVLCNGFQIIQPAWHAPIHLCSVEVIMAVMWGDCLYTAEIAVV